MAGYRVSMPFSGGYGRLPGNEGMGHLGGR